MLHRCPFGPAKKFVVICFTFVFLLLSVVAVPLKANDDMQTLTVYKCHERGDKLFREHGLQNDIDEIIQASNPRLVRLFTVIREAPLPNGQVYKLDVNLNEGQGSQFVFASQASSILEQHHNFALIRLRRGVSPRDVTAHRYGGPGGERSIFRLADNLRSIEFHRTQGSAFLNRGDDFYLAPEHQRTIDPLYEAMHLIQESADSPPFDDDVFTFLVGNQSVHLEENPLFYSGILGIGPDFDVYTLTGLPYLSSGTNSERHFLGFLFEQRNDSGIERYFVTLDQAQRLPRSSPSIARRISPQGSRPRSRHASSNSERRPLASVDEGAYDVPRQNSDSSSSSGSVFGSPGNSPRQHPAFLVRLRARMDGFSRRLSNHRHHQGSFGSQSSGSPSGSPSGTNSLSMGADDENPFIYMNINSVSGAANHDNPADNPVNPDETYAPMSSILSNSAGSEEGIYMEVNTGRDNTAGNHENRNHMYTDGIYVLGGQGNTAENNAGSAEGTNRDNENDDVHLIEIFVPDEVLLSSQPETSTVSETETSPNINDCGQCNTFASDLHRSK